MRILAECKSCRAQYDVSDIAPGKSVRCRCGGSILVQAPRVQDARVVRCASCGASREASGESCAFCGSVFSSAEKGWGCMCPVCYCRIPTDARFCVECGVKIAPVSLNSTESKLLCPRCRTAMVARDIDQVKMHECPSCAGTWLGVDTFDSVCRSRENQAVATRGLAASRSRIRFELTENEKVKYVPCPECKALMNRRNFATISGVVIDTCKAHGVWLDNQELGRIVKFIESGGLERSRQRDAENAAHDERMRRLRAPQPGTAPLPILTPSYSRSSDKGLDFFQIADFIADIFTSHR